MDRVVKKKKFTIKRIIGFAGFLISATIILYTYFAGSSTRKLKVKEDRLRVFTVKEGEFREFISIRGNVLPINTIYLDAVEGGTVEEIFVEDGAMLDSGDAILRLDNANLLMDIMNREAEFYEQQNNLRNTRLSLEQNKLKLKNDLIEYNYQLQNNERVYNRNKQLFKSEHISEEEFLQSKNNYEYMKNKRDITLESQRMDSLFRRSQIQQLERSVNRMENNLEFVKKKLENLIVKAPLSGQLTSLNAEIGQSKNQGSRLGQIDIISSYKVQAPIDEYYINRIAIGKTGKFKVNEKEYVAEIIKIYPQITNGSFNVDFKIDSNIEDIRRGQTILIELELSESTNSLLVSRDGFYGATGGKWIYKLDETEKTAIKQEIELGRQNPDYFEIKSGINEGEKVIVSSYSNFKDYDVLILE
jgi:HlyD family secretion protein